MVATVASTQTVQGVVSGQDLALVAASVPSAPSGLIVNYATDSSLSLVWTLNSTTENSVEVEQSSDGVTGWSQILSLPAGTTSTTASGLVVDNTYYFRVATSNLAGSSDYSNVASGTTTNPNPGDVTADYALEIIQPRTGLGTFNRFYKQYTGIEYNVRLGVIGGTYPNYTFSLPVAPSGMTINPATGEITWPNPVEAGSPHSVTARVVDSDGTQQEISWTITVTTSGFKFVDSVSGNDTNAGTLAAPWATLEKIKDAAASDFIYFRTGSYSKTVLENWDSSWPLVWMAYPGETPSLDLTASNIFVAGGGDNRIYFDGFNVTANIARAFTYTGGQSNLTFRRNTFSNLTGGTGSNNASYIFATATDVYGNYTVIQDNTVTEAVGGYFVLGYGNNKVLVEDNNITGMTGSSGSAISPKDGNGIWFVRNNFYSGDGRIIDIQGYDSRNLGRGAVVIEYNNFLTSTGVFGVNSTVQNEPVIVKRNTLQGGFYVRPYNTNNGPYTFSKNIIINDYDSTSVDRITLGPEGGLGRIIYDDNISGSSSEGIIDSSGNLIGAYRAAYLGSYGHET